MSKDNRKAYRKAERLLDRIGPVWQERMGLSHIEIEHHYLEASSGLLLGKGAKNSPSTVRCGFQANETTYTAFVETRWNYQLADVYFMLPSVVSWNKDTLEQILVHEYSHILTAVEQYLLEHRLDELAADEAMSSTDLDLVANLYYERMEMSTENVARAIWKAWPSAV